MTKHSRLFLLILFLSFFLSSSLFAYEGDDLGYIDAVMVNGVHFEDLDENEIVFYPEDLTDGKVEIRGLLEEEGDTPLDELAVEVTVDGGMTWQKTDGSGDWVFVFEPELERPYEFALRVVKAGGVEDFEDLSLEQTFVLQMGPFTLHAKGALKNGSLSGTGALEIGELAKHLPRQMLDERRRLKVGFQGLHLDKRKTKVDVGQIKAQIGQRLSLFANGAMNISGITFTSRGATLAGSLSFNDGLHVPVIPFYDLNLTPEGISGTLVWQPRRHKIIPLVGGTYGVSARIRRIELAIDSANGTLGINDLDASLHFSRAFGELKGQALSFADGAWLWGSRAAEAAQGANFTLPGTAISVSNIGGAIKDSFSGISLTGTLKIPCYGDMIDVDLSELSELEISPRGLSTLAPVVLDKLDLKKEIAGFQARVEKLSFQMANNIIDGAVSGRLELAQLGANAGIDIKAEIGASGLHRLKADATVGETLSIPNFADLSLARVKLTMTGSDLAVSIDGGLTLTHPQLQGLTEDTGRDLVKEKTEYYQNLSKAGVGRLAKTTSSARGAARNAKKAATRQAAKSGRYASQQLHDFAFRNLKIMKDRLELPASISGWHTLQTPLTASIDGISLSATGWGLGTDAKGLWAGIKGDVASTGATFSGGARATAQFHMDGSYQLLDFAANASLALGAFTLHTDATLSGGRITGSGSLVSNQPMPELPAALMDSEQRLNLAVRFTDLLVDSARSMVTEGLIEVPMPNNVSMDLGMVQVTFRKLSFSPEAALADANITFDGFPGMEALALDSVAFSETGFAASGSITFPEPFDWSFFEGPAEIRLTLRGFDYSLDTGAMDFGLRNLDADLVLGDAYGGDGNKIFPLDVKDNLFTWGESALSGAVSQASGAAQQAADAVEGQVDDGISSLKNLKIPGTDIKIQHPGGSLTLGDNPSISLSGVLEIPGFDTPFRLPIPADSPLVISADGISTRTPITLDEALAQIDLEGFPFLPTRLSFAALTNQIDLSMAGNLALPTFGGITLAVAADFDGFGVDTLAIDLDNMAQSFSIDGFADVAIHRVATGFGEDGLYVDLDCDIALTHPMLQGLAPPSASDALAAGESVASDARDQAEAQAQSLINAGKDGLAEGQDALTDTGTEAARVIEPIALRGLKVYKDALDFGEGLAGWHDLTPPAMAQVDQLKLMLQKWGIGAEGNRFWLGVKGGIQASAGRGAAAAEGEATAQFYSDGSFRLLDMNFAGELSFGPFRLLTDAQYSSGTLSGSGLLVSDEPMPDLPAALKDETGKLQAAVDFEDLAVNAGRKLITSGTITLPTAFDLSATLSEGKELLMAVRGLEFSPQGLALSGKISLPEVAGMVALPDLEVAGLRLGPSGITGRSVLAAVWDEASPKRIEIIESLGLAVMLTRLELTLDWDKPGMNKLKFNGIDGAVDLGTLFDKAESARDEVLRFVDGALTFEIPNVTLPNSDLGFSDIVATLDLTSGMPKLNLNEITLAIPLYGAPLTVTGTEVSIGSSGLSGTFAMDTEELPSLEAFGFGAKVKELAVAFDRGAVTRGDIGLALTLEQFHNLAFDVSGSLTEAGITGLAMDVDPGNLPKIDIENLAEISLSRASIGGAIQEGLYFDLFPTFHITNEMLATLPELTLQGVKVYKDRLEAGGVSLAQSLSGLNFDLGPAAVTLKNIGVTVSEDDLSLSIFGNINLADICGSDLTLALSKDGLSVPNIDLNYNQAGIAMEGDLKWEDEAFAAAVGMSVAEVFEFDGNIAFGREKTGTQSFTYWGATLSVGTGEIPIGAIPVSIYKIGGGLAYHMKVNTAQAQPGQPEPDFFVPDGRTDMLFVARTQVGTSGDQGYTWHGDMALSVDLSNGLITFYGESYALCKRSESPANRKLVTHVELGASPMLFHIGAQATLFQKEKNIELFRIEGMFDILFSETDWHIHVGTKENKLSVTALEGIFHGDGYLMIDSSGLMLGVSKSFSASGSIACFYGKLYGGASLELETGIRPFYIDAEGKIWIGIEAGVKAMGKKYAIIEAYADLALRIRAPDPSFMRIKAKFRYSFCGGLVSGTYRMTFWVPEKPSGDAATDDYNFPLITWLSPDEGDEDVSRVPQFELNTSLGVDRIIRMDDGYPYILRLVDMHSAITTYGQSYDFVNARDIDDVKRALLVARSNGSSGTVPLVGGLLDGDTVKMKPFDELAPSASYMVRAQAMLLRLKKNLPAGVDINSPGFGNYVKEIANVEAIVVHTFTTGDQEDLTARTVVEKVYPNAMTRVVYPDTEVRIHYRVPSLGQSVSLNNIHTIKDPLGRVVVNNSPWQQGLATTDHVHATEEWIKFVKPASPLVPIVVYRNNFTGEVREAETNGVVEVNPFLNDAVAEASSEGMTSVSLANAQVSQMEPVERERGITTQVTVPTEPYTRLVKNTYRVEVHDPQGEELLYSARVKVTAGTEAASNDEVLEATENQPGINPFDITFVLSGHYKEEHEVGAWNIAYEALKESLLAAFKRGDYGFPPGVNQYSFGVQEANFEEVVAVYTAIRRDLEEWLEANPQPVSASSYASEYGDAVLRFTTDRPLDWSSLEMVLDMRVSDGPWGWGVRADRSHYRIVSPPTSCEHILVVPVGEIIRAENDPMELMGFQETGPGYYLENEEPEGDAYTDLYRITTGVDDSGRYTISRSGDSLLHWSFDYARDVLYYEYFTDHYPDGYPFQNRRPIYAAPEFKLR